MPEYMTPGVYYERADTSRPGIAPLRTDVAAFVGIARRGPLHQAIPVQSWRQFQAYFGGLTGAGYLAYAVRAFFENGGQRCWIVRVASEEAATAAALLSGAAPSRLPIWRVKAISPGAWGNDLEIRITETHRAQTQTDPARSTAEYATVAAVAGFRRATLVRLSQEEVDPAWRVISDVDAAENRLWWLHPKPEARLPYDATLTGFAFNRSILVESVEYTLTVREKGRLLRVYEGLSLVPEHPRYGPIVLPRLDASHYQSAAGTAPTLPAAPEPVAIREARPEEDLTLIPEPIDVPAAGLALTGGADGLALLKVRDWIGEPVDPADSDEVRAYKLRGLQVLDAEWRGGEISIVAVPDIHIQPRPEPEIQPLPVCVPDPCLPPGPPWLARPTSRARGDLPPRFSDQEIYQVQAALVEQCERRRDRIALLDPPFSAACDDQLGVGAARAWRSRFDSRYAAYYYPWIRVADPLQSTGELVRDVPPSGHVAGYYAQTDLRVGVHKAPANGPLQWAQDVTAAVNDAVHGVLNPLGINAIRVLPGRGLRIMGARTVSSDTDYRFVNVRRLMIMIEKAIDLSIQWAVFEPNDALTRAKIQLALMSFLVSLWQQGALAGKTYDEAFYVKCDEENNPPYQRDEGRLLAEVGVAPSLPFEFVVLRVGRVGNELEITEV